MSAAPRGGALHLPPQKDSRMKEHAERTQTDITKFMRQWTENKNKLSEDSLRIADKKRKIEYRDAHAKKHFPNSYIVEIAGLQVKLPDERVFLPKADASDAFRNVRVSLELDCCHVLEDVLVVADLGVTVGWGSLGFWE